MIIYSMTIKSSNPLNEINLISAFKVEYLHAVRRILSGENPALRLGDGYRSGHEYLHRGDPRRILQQRELVRVRVQRAVEKEIRITVNSKDSLNDGGPGELESPGPAHQTNRDPRLV